MIVPKLGRRVLLAFAALSWLSTVSSVAGAAAAATEDPAAAREHYERGTRYYDIGRYDEAIKEFEAAYEKKPDPAFIYNLAQAHRFAGHSQEAARLYRTYLRYVPNAANRADIESKIAALEKAAPGDRPEGTAPPAPGATATPPNAEPTSPPPASSSAIAGGTTTSPNLPGVTPTTDATTTQPAAASTSQGRSRRQSTAIVIASIGGALFLTGAVFGLVAENAENRVERAGTRQERFDPGVESLGRTAETLQWVGYGIGLAGVATGLVLYFTGREQPRDAPAFNRTVARTVAGTVAHTIAVAPFASGGAHGGMIGVSF